MAAAAKLKDFSLAGDNTNFKKAKKACTKAFGKCHKLEDEVGGALSACSATNSPKALQAAIAAGTKIKAAANAVTKKVAEVFKLKQVLLRVRLYLQDNNSYVFFKSNNLSRQFLN